MACVQATISDQDSSRLYHDNVPCALVAEWSRIEAAAFCVRLEAEGRSSADGGALRHPLATETREMACKCMLNTVREAFSCRPVETWFEAVTLVDSYCHNCAVQIEPAALPALCSSVLRVLLKSENSVGKLATESLASGAEKMAEKLRRAGHAASACTDAEVNGAEVSLLKVTSWRVSLPSLESWARTFLARLGVLSRDRYLRAMSDLWQKGLITLRLVAHRRANGPQLLPSRVARGVLSLGLLSAGLIRADFLRPDGYDEASWGKTLSAVFPCGCAGGGTAAASERLLEHWVAATLTSREELVSDCGLAAGLLCEVLDEMSAAQHSAAPRRVAQRRSRT